MLLLLHQVIEKLLLVRRQLLANFLLNIVVFVMNVRRHLVPQIANSFLRITDDFFNARVLFWREVEILLHAPHQFHFAQLLEGEGWL